MEKRIQRRQYGDYRDPKQNHKRDFPNYAWEQAVKNAGWSGVRHPGSKKWKQLRRWL